MSFPRTRLRRSRRYEFSRNLVSETSFSARNDLIWPIFIHEHQTCEQVPSMPGVMRYSLERALRDIEHYIGLGLNSVAVFPVIEAKHKDDQGSWSLNRQNIMYKACHEITNAFPNLGVIADVALDPYTSHGHDGILDENDYVDNDTTIAVLRDQALLLAEAGANIIAPSDMQDGRIGLIRDAFEKRGHRDTILLSYSAKYASAFYGPFRDAVGSSGHLQGASKETYQMAVGNAQEALREARLDIEEGADWLMVKPGMNYLDIVSLLRDHFSCPILAYQVSGEYSMLMALAEMSGQNPQHLFHEAFMAFKRAGARGILSYYTPRMLELTAG